MRPAKPVESASNKKDRRQGLPVDTYAADRGYDNGENHYLPETLGRDGLWPDTYAPSATLSRWRGLSRPSPFRDFRDPDYPFAIQTARLRLVPEVLQVRSYGWCVGERPRLWPADGDAAVDQQRKVAGPGERPDLGHKLVDLPHVGLW
jgi:hypothetical protein